MNYARRWGFGGLLIGNLFAYRSTDKTVLATIEDPVGPDNDQWLKRLQCQAARVVCAWGDPGSLGARDEAVLQLLREPHCLVTLKSGRPGHPLYKSAALNPQPLQQ